MSAWYTKGLISVKRANDCLDFDYSELSQKIQDALEYRAAGWTLQEIADTEGVTLQAIQHRLHKAIGYIHYHNELSKWEEAE